MLEVMREATAEELKEKHEAELMAERTAEQKERDRASSELATLSGQVSSLREREAQAKALIESQLQGVVSSMNDTASYLAAILLALGCLDVFSMATGSSKVIDFGVSC